MPKLGLSMIFISRTYVYPIVHAMKPSYLCIAVQNPTLNHVCFVTISTGSKPILQCLICTSYIFFIEYFLVECFIYGNLEKELNVIRQ